MRLALLVLLACGLFLLVPHVLAQQPVHRPGGFHSPEIQKDASWSHVMNETGPRYYHCHPHPFMEGAVRVEEGAPSEPVTIEIRGFKFVPESLTVGLGTNVTWVNRDAAPHTVDESLPPTSDETRSGTPGFSSALLLVSVLLLVLARRE